jgi:hypothetical protein
MSAALKVKSFTILRVRAQVEWRPSWSLAGCERREEAFGQSDRQAVPGRLGGLPNVHISIAIVDRWGPGGRGSRNGSS